MKHGTKLLLVAMYALLAPLVPWGKCLAVSDTSAWWTHVTYMLGHAGWLHYALNGLGWVLIWPILTPARTLTAMALAAMLPPEAVPVLGWSVILYYYTGLCMADMRTGARIRLLMLVGAGFFIPWIAAWHHAAMLMAGWMMRKIEKKWEKTMR